MRAFADNNPSGGTTDRIVTDWAGTKKAETALNRKRIPYTSPSELAKTSPMASTARIKSLAIIVRFTFQRSTNTPATGPTRANGTINDTVMKVTCAAVALRVNDT